MKIIYVAVGKEPQVINVNDDLKTMQELVGGYIEHHSMGGGLAMICNEEGVFLNLPQNGCGVLGPYFFTKVNVMGDYVDLSDKECDAVLAHVAMYRTLRHSGKSEFKLTNFNSVDELIEHLRRERSGENN